MRSAAKDQPGLLAYLTQRAGYLYISDLRYRIDRDADLRQALREVCPTAYSSAECIEAVTYITGRAHSFYTAAQALQYLDHYLAAGRPENGRDIR